MTNERELSKAEELQAYEAGLWAKAAEESEDIVAKVVMSLAKVVVETAGQMASGQPKVTAQ